jgi:hypothetical protein
MEAQRALERLGEVERIVNNYNLSKQFSCRCKKVPFTREMCTVTFRFVIKVSEEHAMVFTREILASWVKRGKPLPYIQASSQLAWMRKEKKEEEERRKKEALSS